MLAGPSARLCALCHRRKSRPAACVRTHLPLRAHVCCRSCATRSTDTTPPDLDKTAQSISRCCQLHPFSLVHTRTHTQTDRYTHTHSSSIPLTFSKPRTHSRTFSRMSVSISQMLGGSCRKDASKGIKPKSGRSRCSCGQLQYPATDCD